MHPFSTPLTIVGPSRRPAQMLQEQEYGGHASLHDDATADKLGFRGAPIEGPTHFSLFPPLLHRIWGQQWFERGTISAHYQNMVIEGEETRAFVEYPGDGPIARAWAQKADGTPVLEASCHLDDAPTLLETRIAAMRQPGPLVILQDMHVGMKGAAEERARMDPDQHMGNLYPFSLNQKLAKITETSPWYTDDKASPWGRRIVPLEMVSVLAQYTSGQARWPVKGPAIGLFADQQIRMIDGPLFVGEDYVLRREIIFLSESKRVESYWARTQIFDTTGKHLKAEMLLNSATLKHSYADYDALRAAREKAG